MPSFLCLLQEDSAVIYEECLAEAQSSVKMRCKLQRIQGQVFHVGSAELHMFGSLRQHF